MKSPLLALFVFYALLAVAVQRVGFWWSLFGVTAFILFFAAMVALVVRITDPMGGRSAARGDGAIVGPEGRTRVGASPRASRRGREPLGPAFGMAASRTRSRRSPRG